MSLSSDKFSVLMPVYYKDHPAFLDKALQSIINQTLPPAEIVLVADGTLTPELDEILDHYMAGFENVVRLIRLEKNMGMGFAMDTGLRACQYEYVARMDSDDIAKPDRFSKQIGYLQAHPEVDILGSFIEEFEHEPGDLRRHRKVAVEHEDIVNYARSRSPFNHMTVVYKKSKVIEAGSYWFKRNLEDYNLWFNMIRAGHQCYNIPEVLVDARVGNNMVGRRRGMNYFHDELAFFRHMRDERFISGFHYYKIVTIRLLTRISPLFLTDFIYKRMLR